MERKHRHRAGFRVLVPLVILAVAVGITVMLVVTKPEPTTGEPPREGPLVEVVPVARSDVAVTVDGHGTVAAARELEVQPQVTGALIRVNPNLVPGGVIKAGETLFRIDPKDHRLNLEQSRAQLAQAESELAMEKGRHRIAAKEWEIYQERFDVAGEAAAPELAQREPQLEAAEVNLRSSRAEVAKNRVALSRTEVTVPFDAMVDSETAELGLLVTPQTVVAKLVGVEHFWVRAVIPIDRLGDIDSPGPGGEGGARVVVRQAMGAEVVEREGRVIRVLGRLDAQSRLARVLIEAPDPLGLESLGDENRGLPLLVDAYVEVEIAGKTLQDVVEVPREALHEGDQVYVFSDGVLEVRRVEVAWRRDETVLVDAGLTDGERIVVSRIAQPVDGMPLRALDAASPRGDETRE